MAQKIKEVVLDCMDPRCTVNETEGTFKFRRAGGFTGNMKDYMPIFLRRHEIEKITIRIHDNCGAITFTHDAIKEQRHIEENDIYGAFVEPFLRYIPIGRHLERKRLEDIAVGIQQTVAVTWRNGTSLKEIDCIRVPTTGTVEGRKTLLLTVPTSKKFADIINSFGSHGLDPKSTYVVTLVPGEVKRMTADPNIAIKYLKIPNVVLYRGDEDHYGVIDSFWGAFNRGDIRLPETAKVLRYD